MARPVEWTNDLKIKATTEIFERIAEGESVRSILNKNRENLPSNRLFLQWLAENEELGKQYVYAMEMRAEKMADEILAICDATEDDVITTEDGREIPNYNVINRDRLRVDTRKWLLSKLHPRKYGDKISAELTGKDGKELNTAPPIILQYEGKPIDLKT